MTASFGGNLTIEELVLATFTLDVALCRSAVGMGSRVGVRVPAADTLHIPALVGVKRRREHTTARPYRTHGAQTFEVEIELVAERLDPHDRSIRILSFDVDRVE